MRIALFFTVYSGTSLYVMSQQYNCLMELYTNLYKIYTKSSLFIYT